MRALVLALLIALPAAASAGDAPPAGMPGRNSVVGLLQLPGIFGPPESGGIVPPAKPVPVPAWAAPGDGAARLPDLTSPDGVESQEYTYEGGAAVVYETRPSWYRIAAGKPGARKAAWIKAADAGEYMPIGTLLVDSMAYLNGNWDGRIWEEPGGARSSRSTLKQAVADEEYTVDVQEARMVGGALWLRLETFDQSPCEGDEPKVVDRGWVPAHSPKGRLVAGFYSRGC